MLGFGGGHPGPSGSLSRTRDSRGSRSGRGEIGIIGTDSDRVAGKRTAPGPAAVSDSPSQYLFKSVRHQNMVSARPCLNDSGAEEADCDTAELSLLRRVLGQLQTPVWGYGGVMLSAGTPPSHSWEQAQVEPSPASRRWRDFTVHLRHGHAPPIQSPSQQRKPVTSAGPGGATSLTA